MADLSISNIINVSISAAPAGLGAYNTSNIGLFTHEIPANTFGSDMYKIYKSPSEVVKDFGSASVSGNLAVSIFSQKPNILAGSGYLVVMQYADTPEVQHIAFSTDPVSGSYTLTYGSLTTGSIAANSNATTVQTALRALAGLSNVTVTGSEASGFDVTFVGVVGNATLLTATPTSLQNSVPASVTITITTTTPGVAETLEDAINRTSSLVQYFGIITDTIQSSQDLLDAAALVQTMNKILFAPSKTASDVNTGGLLDQLRTGSLNQTRGLLYIGSGLDLDALKFAAAYAGRGLSTDFSGSNTTQTMHLKDLAGIQPDSGMNETIKAKCEAAGADIYASIQGVPKVLCFGANMFFDRIYNQRWFAGALEVAGFNILAQSSTKLPQTEQGLGILKGAYRQVCEQAVANQYAAPGAWNSPDTFGVLGDFYDNITQRGYYIYSAPISQQAQVDREARKAPLIQIALKEAGAIQSSNVLIFINP